MSFVIDYLRGIWLNPHYALELRYES